MAVEVTAPAGLTTAEVAERVADGLANVSTIRTSRTVGEIVRANVFTVFNGLLAALFVLVMTTGHWQNALFGGVVVANAAIGIVQELRAKRTLDRLAVLNAPRARVLREGAERDIPVAEVVRDDLLVLTATAFLVAAVVGVTGVVLVELVDRLAGRPASRHDAHVPSSG